MNPSTLLKTSILATIVAAICCFTPALVILLGAVGLATWTGYLDMILIPALVLFIGLTIYAFMQHDKALKS
ncbi:MAG: mercury resistance system transport protein MerF [Mariprofundaceae bacterium]|nr:mercury resistance system transport protein MerF [Mariprofundaceae bacterium]